MKLIVGLGNPGDEYKKTRHNCGFLAVCDLQKNLNESFSNFKFNKKFNALISQGNFNEEKIILTMPETFMNNSGQTVRKIIENYLPMGGFPKGEKLEIENLFVIHDDLDLFLGKIKISKNSGSAGQKGVQPIIDCLGTKNFIRLRIGIRPDKIYDAHKFVLQKFNKEEQKIISESLEKINLAVKMILEKGVEQAMNKYN